MAHVVNVEAGVVVRTGLLSVPSVPRALPAPLSVLVPLLLRRWTLKGKGSSVYSSETCISWVNIHSWKVAAMTHFIFYFLTRSYIMKLFSFSYLAGQPVLIVKDPVRLPNRLPHHNASKIKPSCEGHRITFSSNQRKKKWRCDFLTSNVSW